MAELTHFDESGASRMVDVGHKPTTRRRAVASALVRMQPATLALIQSRGHAKGDVLEVARLAGIMGAKRTGELIPLCHPLPIDSVSILFEAVSDTTLSLVAEVATTGKTGVEMEALTAATTAALTVYDMVKSVDRGVVIERVQLEHKSGGKSGDWNRSAAGVAT
ncbi:cyclic pyranopterin monophosphate synthase MoaC [Aeoliella sp. SH292]|uniref:cyclic pyranopterin monophosphate synthase MoaC n=1 Tax=Aeoliella sp. SH292 TaxID=3454464 RepID=UPI003F96AF32